MTAPDPSVLLDLAERCERATGPDRELDARIFYAIHPTMQLCGSVEEYLATGVSKSLTSHYTASIDAAMTLVPEGALWKLHHLRNIGRGKLFERPRGEPETIFGAGVGVGDVPAIWTDGRHFTSGALALCAAALRARSTDTGGK